MFATDVSEGDEGTYELAYSSHETPPETMARAVLASAAITALVLPLPVGDRIATDGGWVRNFPLGCALDRPEVELVVAFRYVPHYPHLGVEPLARLRRRLHRFRAVPPVRAFIAELDEAEARERRGEPIHLGDMMVRLMRVAIQHNTALEERLATERENAIQGARGVARGPRQDRERARPAGPASTGGTRRRGAVRAHRAAEERPADHRARVGRRGEPGAGLPRPAGVDRAREAGADRPRLRGGGCRAAGVRRRPARAGVLS